MCPPVCAFTRWISLHNHLTCSHNLRGADLSSVANCANLVERKKRQEIKTENTELENEKQNKKRIF